MKHRPIYECFTLRPCAGEELFPGIRGYRETVIPQIVNGILARHDLLFLGLRGQAKTRILRMLPSLLDEWIPVMAGMDINDDPLHPMTLMGRRRVDEAGVGEVLDRVLPADRLAPHEDAGLVAQVEEQRVERVVAAAHEVAAEVLELLHVADEQRLGLVPSAHKRVHVEDELDPLDAELEEVPDLNAEPRGAQ